MIKPRKTRARSMILRLCSEAFDPKLYRLRKCGGEGLRSLARLS